MRVVTLDSWRRARAIVTDGVWGNSKNKFLDWAAGETVIFLIGRDGVVTGSISGPRFRSDHAVWNADAHEWHVPLADVALIEGAAGRRLNEGIRDVIRHCYGEPIYFRVLLHGVRLGDEPELRVRELLPSPTSTGQSDVALGSGSEQD